MARGVSRGEIWMYRFALPDKRRPVLVISRQRALDKLRTAIVAPITTTMHGLPSEVAVGTADGLKVESVVNLDHLYTVAQADLRTFVGVLDPKRMDAVCSGLAVALGCV
jgi:mRNA interferase MazF